MTCPHCHQNAPTIVRGVRAYCTACGAPRPFMETAEAFNVAGQPRQVGGTVASALGVVVLVVGLLLALVLGAVAGIIANTAAVVVGGGTTLLTLLIAVPLLLGGRKLRKAGDERARAARERAIFTLAAQRRGVLTVRDASRTLELPEADVDAALTALAKRQDSGVSLEVDDNGVISYRFADLVPGPQRVRVADQPWEAPPPAAPPAKAPRVIDAELVEEEDDAFVPPGARRASR